MEATLESKKTKLVTEENITMTNCLNAIKKLRDCPRCPLRYDREKCKAKKCVPQVVIDEIKVSIIAYFQQKKAEKKLSKQLNYAVQDKKINVVDELTF